MYVLASWSSTKKAAEARRREQGKAGTRVPLAAGRARVHRIAGCPRGEHNAKVGEHHADFLPAARRLATQRTDGHGDYRARRGDWRGNARNTDSDGTIERRYPDQAGDAATDRRQPRRSVDRRLIRHQHRRHHHHESDGL